MEAKPITKEEFIRRFKGYMERAGVCQETMTDYVPEAAEAAYSVWNDPSEGLNDMTPEEMAEADRECWE
jgi:hypothetical protein